MRFQEGDVVRIAKTSQYYNSNQSDNPRDMDGEITDVGAIWVKWENGTENVYVESDLKLRRRP